MKNRNVRTLFLFVSFCAVAQTGLFVQSKTVMPRVAVFGFLNLTGDDGFDIPAETAGKNLAFALKMVGGYEVSEPESIARNFSDSRLMKWCVDNGADTVMYGVIQLAPDGSEDYRLSVFDAAKKTTTVRESAAGESVLDVFSVSDSLTAAVLGAITGRHIGFGAVAFTNTGPAGAYGVSIDGVMLDDVPSKVDQIVSGMHLIKVFTGSGDDRAEIHSANVTVRERETITVSFALPTVIAARRAGKIPMVSVKGGSYNDGKVKIQVDSFLIGSNEVTQIQYASVMGRVPKACSKALGLGDTYPVYFVSWYDALVFCNTLSQMEELTPAYSIGGSADPADWGKVPESQDSTWDAVTVDAGANGYRLPAEAEWEFASRGGNNKNRFAYSGSGTVGDVAWYVVNSSSMTHAVGGKASNELGLFDMSGNVFEWCFDRYTASSSLGTNRVLRGGSWDYDEAGCTVDYQASGNPAKATNNRGFRVARRP